MSAARGALLVGALSALRINDSISGHLGDAMDLKDKMDGYDPKSGYSKKKHGKESHYVHLTPEQIEFMKILSKKEKKAYLKDFRYFDNIKEM
jgi:hypothetical protein